MRKTKLLPRKRRMRELKSSDFAGSQEVEVKQQVWFKDSGPFRTIYDQRIIEYKTADGKWHKL